MNKHEDSYDEAWFAALDAIVAGEEKPSTEDDELLRLASKLSVVLGHPRPYPQDTREGYPYHGRDGSASALVHGTDTPRGYPGAAGGGRWLRNVLAVVAACIVLFGVVSACPSSSHVSAATINVGTQIWQTATSFEQIDASSVALLAVKQSGVRPLLPQELPFGTEALALGIITNGNDPRSFRAFAADYRIAGADLSLYEQPGNLVFPSSAASTVLVGTYKGQLFQDDMGNRILSWYQDGMTCSIASTLPASVLLDIARRFQPITNWDLFLG